VTRVFLLVAGLLVVAGAAVGFGSVGLAPMTDVRNTVVTATPTVWVVPAYPGGGR
jgi:hypothetical protein